MKVSRSGYVKFSLQPLQLKNLHWFNIILVGQTPWAVLSVLRMKKVSYLSPSSRQDIFNGIGTSHANEIIHLLFDHPTQKAFVMISKARTERITTRSSEEISRRCRRLNWNNLKQNILGDLDLCSRANVTAQYVLGMSKEKLWKRRFKKLENDWAWTVMNFTRTGDEHSSQSVISTNVLVSSILVRADKMME